MPPPRYAASISSSGTQPLNDDWDAQSVSSFYPSSETPYTISHAGSEAGSIAPYTISRPEAKAKLSGSSVVPFTLTPQHPTPGVFPATPAPASAMQIPYGVPVQPQTYPHSWPLQQNIQPYPAQLAHNVPAQLPQSVPAQLPQYYHPQSMPQVVPQPLQWPPPLSQQQLSNTHPSPDRIGMATAYFPPPLGASQQQFYPLTQPGMQHQHQHPASGHWPRPQAQHFADPASQWPNKPSEPFDGAQHSMHPANCGPSCHRPHSAQPGRKSRFGLTREDKHDLATAAAVALGAVALGALLLAH